MHTGNWSCSGCGAVIKELPFEPKNTTNLLCRDCHGKKRQSSGRDKGERIMHAGNWSCSGCGKAITELPFKPRETGNLLCRDCFKASRNA